jgi:hypothetical protein
VSLIAASRLCAMWDALYCILYCAIYSFTLCDTQGERKNKNENVPIPLSTLMWQVMGSLKVKYCSREGYLFQYASSIAELNARKCSTREQSI